jgi:hypothetical protein
MFLQVQGGSVHMWVNCTALATSQVIYGLPCAALKAVVSAGTVERARLNADRVPTHVRLSAKLFSAHILVMSDKVGGGDR